jgi:glycosyltransferase involved in cell wall biosynthesis
MKILYYNWVDYLDAEGRGGGVSVYQRNLMQAAQGAGSEVAFFSSGTAYDLIPGAPRWEVQRFAAKRSTCYEVVNSGVMAPAHAGFGEDAQLTHPATEAVIMDLIARTGPYDVLHLNNLEGLPLAVLDQIRARWPGMRIILSLHNYYPFCAQVNFWRQERRHCADFEGGAACATCLPRITPPALLRRRAGVGYGLRRLGLRPGTWAWRAVFALARRAGMLAARVKLRSRAGRAGGAQPLRAPNGAGFARRRAQMVAQINSCCDVVLCVSDAVRRIALTHGIDPNIAQTSYIGTLEAARFTETTPRDWPLGGALTLAYLGYMRRDKGFYFLLEALETLPSDLAARIRVVIAAKRGDGGTMARLRDLSRHLAEVVYADGYSHGDLDSLLAGVDLGVVPVLWQDNLPQVAIEMHARHIPLLTSNMGGARELGNFPGLVFRAGDTEGFHDRLRAVLAGRVDQDAYWQGARPPLDMQSHWQALGAVYSGASGDHLGDA